MFFKQFYDEKLAQTSYMVGCQQTNEAMVIDPARILDEYETVAKKEGFTITKVTETHIHADFASGLRDAGHKWNATLYVSDEGDAEWKYANMPEPTVYVKDGDIIEIGKVTLKVLHTPGHTPESISFLLTDHGGGSDVPMGLFTGDFVFVGDIGRPDLLEEAAKMEGTTEVGAKAMFKSIQSLQEYPDFLQIWPGHGAGSACGKSLGAVPLSTLGYERQNNWAFQIQNEQDFIRELTSEQPEPPLYFAQMKKVNKEGLPFFTVKDVQVDGVSPIEGQVLDLRMSQDFRQGFVNGAINIPYNDKFLQYAGWFIDYDKPLTVIANPLWSEQLQEDFARIGFDHLERIVPIDDISSHVNDTYETISAEAFAKLIDQAEHILDVRSTREFEQGHLENAAHVHYGHLRTATIPFTQDTQPLYVHCQSGIRSAIAMSVLKAQGYTHVVDVASGYRGIQAALQR